MQKQVAVIGLGKFGTNLCIALVKQGVQVLAIDTEEKPVQKLSEVVSQAIIADTTDEDVVAELNLIDFDCVVVSFGSDIKASILVTIILKEMGVNNLWVKAKDNLHVKTLKKIGADRVINPERDMAIRISEQLVTEGFIDYLHLPDDVAVYAYNADQSQVGRAFSALPFDGELKLLGVKRGLDLMTALSPDEIVQVGDMLIVGGKRAELQQILVKG